MNDSFVIDTLLSYFGEEISNKVTKENGELVITLQDGTFAKISATILS